jgi:8-oxo-dGTP pyrophosphatase MutT (NUDIX family)
VRFDTGREMEDRLSEAQAHQIYVSIGAEGTDEVREKVLGYPVNPEERVPRFFDSARLGPMPLSYLLAVAGDVDPLTGAPRPGTVEPREFVMVGAAGPDPAADGSGSGGGGPTQVGGVHPKDPGVPKAVHSEKVYPRGHAAVKEEGSPGYGNLRLEDESEEAEDLQKWRANARKAVARGKAPRLFEDSAIRSEIVTAVWWGLSQATTREEVDDAFVKGVAVATTASCPCCGGRGEHATGLECYGCDASGQALGYSGEVPCDGALGLGAGAQIVQRCSSPEEAAYVLAATYDPSEYEAVGSRIVVKRFLTEAEARAAYRDSQNEHRPFAGLALRAADTGRVLMLQRAHTEGDLAAGMWEFPGGHVEDDETTREGAIREWEEEVGCRLPDSALPYSEWDSINGNYRGHVYEIPAETDVDLSGRREVADPDNPGKEYFEAAAWFDPNILSNHPGLRHELAAEVSSVQAACMAPVVKAGGVGPKV